ncbi:MAG: lipopolysaccharide heptosyltransferase II [Elusimicrobia bacterium]|nr:lipopolysaccharide heptosyltransferase II [Elusimicrobiota bacterium]
MENDGGQAAPKILVIRLSSLGDVILTAPVFRNLKDKWHHASISVLVKPQFAAPLLRNPQVADVLPFKNVLQAAREIRKRKFTHIIDLHSTFRTHLICLLSGVSGALRYRKDSVARRLFVNFRVPSPALEKHVLDRYLSVLDKLNVPVVHKFPQIDDWKFNLSDNKNSRGFTKACVIQTAFLGDCVLTLPLLKAMKSLLKNPKITVLARPEMAEVFRNSGQADEIIADEKKKSKFFFPEFLRILRILKSRKFDVAVIPHRSLRSALLAYFAGIPVRIGFDSSAGSFLFTKKIPFTWLLHDVERNMSLLLPFSGNLSSDFPELKLPNAREFGFGGNIHIGISPGSVWDTKRWLPQRYAELIKKLNGRFKTKVLIIGGKNETAWNSDIEKEAGPDSCINITGKTNIPELMAVIKKLKLFITNDSGPMHIATALNVPTIAIFGPTTKELGFFPYGDIHKVIETPLKCRPCALHGSRRCPKRHFLCMRLITTDMVFNAAVEMLKGLAVC